MFCLTFSTSDPIDKVDKYLYQSEGGEEEEKSYECIDAGCFCFFEFFIIAIRFRILDTGPDDRTDSKEGTEGYDTIGYSSDKISNLSFCISS
jgi:hypothetical protein